MSRSRALSARWGPEIAASSDAELATVDADADGGFDAVDAAQAASSKAADKAAESAASGARSA